MGKVMTVLKIFPAENYSLEKLEENLKSVDGFNSVKEEELAFGIKALIASFICEDSEGKDYEEIVKKIDGVGEVQVEEVGLV